MIELKQLELTQQQEDFQHKKIQDLSFKANQAKHLSKLANELVIEQSEQINIIEKEFKEAHQNTEKAGKQLNEVNSRQADDNSKLFCYAGSILFIVLALMILMIMSE